MNKFSICEIENSNHFFNQDLNLVLDNYADKNQYHINRVLPIEWINFKIKTNNTYNLIFVIHHFGYENSTLAIGAFLLFLATKSASVILEIEPYVTSIFEEIDKNKKDNIKLYLEKTIATALGQIASEF